LTEEEMTLRHYRWDEEDRLRAVDLMPDSDPRMPEISNYTYDADDADDADGERIVRYVPGRLDAFYSANNAGFSDRLERFIYPSGLLTVKTLPSMNNQFKQIATYTKHYYIGAERISSVIGRGNGIGQNLLEPCDSSFPSTQDIFTMNNEKVQEAEDALQDDYQFFEKQLVMSESFSNRPGCFAMSYTGEHNAYWFHPDHLGSSSYISNKNKEISQHLEYFPFGETLVEEHKNSNNSPYRFNAKELDNETGNYFYGARYLNPKFSIWLSVNPMSEKYPGWSPYNYTLQNPVKLIDPDGRSVEESSCPNPPCNGGYGDNGYLGPGRDDVNISIDYSEGVYSTKSDNSSSKDNSSSSDWAKDQINRLEPEPYDALEIYHEDGVGSRG